MTQEFTGSQANRNRTSHAARTFPEFLGREVAAFIPAPRSYAKHYAFCLFLHMIWEWLR